MDHEDETQHQDQSLIHNRRGTIFQWSTRQKILIRRRKLQSVRLGGRKGWRGFFLVRMFRRIKLRWLKLQYSCMLKKLKDIYFSVVKELIEAGATLESVQQRIMIETYFAVPVLGVSVAGIPSHVGSHTGSNRVRSNK